jgi:hypothetical protein
MAAKKGDLGAWHAPKRSNFIPKWPNFEIVPKAILIARSKKPEQGNLLSQPAPYLFYFKHDPRARN